MSFQQPLLTFFSRIVLSSTAPSARMQAVKTVNGEFIRQASAFRNHITADGSSGFKAEMGRYHLYVSLACPFAHRTLIVRKIKGLEDVLPYTVVDWLMGSSGWAFTDQKPKCSLDTVNGCRTMREIYELADPAYEGRYTVPVLWDKTKKTIVNNESSEIMRMINSEFNAFCKTDAHRNVDLYPENLRTQIDDANSWIQPEINNGVYRAGFATTQEAYDDGVKVLFNALEKAENLLSKQRYVTGNTLTEADIRLFNSLVRFDKVYLGHFKCNKKRVIDYPNLWGFARDIYQTDKIADTVDFEHITNHYMQSHRGINPHGIVAVGPDLDFNSPHGRENVGI